MAGKKVTEHNASDKDVYEKISFRNFRLRSEAAQEIIDRKPSFVEKWALLVFFLILTFLFAGTWFIRYPDIIQVRATLIAVDGPKEIMPMQSGRLTKLFVKNGDSVKEGELIGWIESTAKPEEILLLSKLLDSSAYLLSKNRLNEVSNLFRLDFRNLGSLQSYYQTYTIALQQFNDYSANGFYTQKQQMILNDIASISNMDSALIKQRQLTEKDNELSRQTYEMNEKLFKEKVITEEEYRQEQSKMFNKQMAMPQINSNILSNQNQQRDKLKELQQLQHDIAQQKITFDQALQTLKSNIDDWKRQYLLLCPFDGTLFFTTPIEQNQFIERGKLLGYVNPPGKKFYVEAFLPQYNLGKIDLGMEVHLQFDAYPYEETGFVKGRLNYISKVSSDSGYMATIQLVNGLQTNLHKSVQYKSGLKANALIITANIRLLQRFYYKALKLTSQGR